MRMTKFECGMTKVAGQDADLYGQNLGADGRHEIGVRRGAWQALGDSFHHRVARRGRVARLGVVERSDVFVFPNPCPNLHSDGVRGWNGILARNKARMAAAIRKVNRTGLCAESAGLWTNLPHRGRCGPPNGGTCFAC